LEGPSGSSGFGNNHEERNSPKDCRIELEVKVEAEVEREVDSIPVGVEWQ